MFDFKEKSWTLFNVSSWENHVSVLDTSVGKNSHCSVMELLNWEHPDIYLMDDNCTSSCAVYQCNLQGEFLLFCFLRRVQCFCILQTDNKCSNIFNLCSKESLFLKLVILGYYCSHLLVVTIFNGVLTCFSTMSCFKNEIDPNYCAPFYASPMWHW